MDFEKASNVSSEDTILTYEGGFRLVCDPKSLLYLFGKCRHGTSLSCGAADCNNSWALAQHLAKFVVANSAC